MIDERFQAIDRSLLWGFEGTEVPKEVIERGQAGLLTGVTLFRNFNSLTKSVAADITGQLAEVTDGLPLIVAIDQETGQFLGLGGSMPFAGNLALGAVDDPDLTESVGRMIAAELRSVGITMNYAPVADVISQPDNPSLGIRSFGADPDRVATHVGAMIRGMHQGGILTVAKHFPGKGEARSDPHHDLPVLDVDIERLDQVDLPPFHAATNAGVDGIMVGHYALPHLNGGRHDLPATVAPAIVGDLLRTRLGFDGLAITDALDMGSLAQGEGATIEAIAAVRAGLDLLLCSAHLDRAEALSAGLQLAYSRALIDPASVRAGHHRITRAQRRLAELSVTDFDARAARRLADELARRAVTLVRDESNLLPIENGARVVSIMVEPTDLTPADTSSHESPGLATALATHFDVAHDVVVGYQPSGDDIGRARAAAADADIAIIGTITANAAQAELVRKVSEVSPTVTVALRTPFDLAAYPTATTHVCVYGLLEPSLVGLADALVSGQMTGRLPCPIGNLYPAGHRLPR